MRLQGFCEEVGHHVEDLCFCDEQIDDFDPRKTQQCAPLRFDVNGNLVTGEFDAIDTPEVELIEDTDVIDLHDHRHYFWVGVAVGAMMFSIAVATFMIVRSL